jgi:tRNA-5-methyluridine54 2-sulfurtransferase
MRCRKCLQKALIKLARHNTAFCASCFDDYVLDQVRRAIRSNRMMTHQDKIAVAVSGGKDSLALWDILDRLGYSCAGIHINLGIHRYSDASQEKTEQFARQRHANLILHDLKTVHGSGIPELAQKTDRPACSACGVMKRYNFNQLALESGFTVVATGHNLDDEASRLLGNVLHWQVDYLDKQAPALPSTHPRLLKKVKPLFRLAEREMAAYCVLRKINYIVEECPMSRDAKQLMYKDALNRLEEVIPGTKQNFYFEFLKRRRADILEADVGLRDCIRCGQPTTAEVCSYCKLAECAADANRGQAVGKDNTGLD